MKTYKANQKAAYNAGFKVGEAWIDDYIPGGFWYIKECRSNYGKHCDVCIELKLNHDLWMKGFHDGNK